MPTDPNKSQPAAPSRTALRAKLAGLKKPASELVPLTIDGESITLEVHGLTAGERWRLLDQANVSGVDGEGEAVSKFSLAAYGPHLLQLSVRDPHSGQKVWSDTEIDDIGALPSDVAEKLSEAAARLSGLNKAARDAGKSASATPPGSATGSSSPTN